MGDMADMAADCIDMSFMQMLEDDDGYACDHEDTCDYGPGYSRRSVNHLYYHVPLFDENELNSIVRETEKAILFCVPAGLFWVPKSLIRGDSVRLVHKCFKRKYVSAWLGNATTQQGENT
jgi:hypothetical protein